MQPYLFCLVLLLPAAALADSPPVYKWTDATGVIHYSDRPPLEAAMDAVTLDLPPLPPQDPAAIAARQAALLAQLAGLQQLQQSRDIQRQQAAALARQQAELTAALAALQQAQSAPGPLIYSTSAFVPAIYRRNLYIHHRHPDHARDGGPQPSSPAKLVVRFNPHP